MMDRRVSFADRLTSPDSKDRAGRESISPLVDTSQSVDDASSEDGWSRITQHDERKILLAHEAVRGQEMIIAQLKKENFDLKIRIFFLNQKIVDTYGCSAEDMIKDNIDLKVEVEKLRSELRVKEDLMAKASKVMDSLSSQNKKHTQRVSEITSQYEQKLAILVTELEQCKSKHESMDCGMEMTSAERSCVQEVSKLKLLLEGKDVLILKLQEELSARNSRIEEQQFKYTEDMNSKDSVIKALRNIIAAGSNLFSPRKHLAFADTLQDSTQVEVCAAGRNTNSDVGIDQQGSSAHDLTNTLHSQDVRIAELETYLAAIIAQSDKTIRYLQDKVVSLGGMLDRHAPGEQMYTPRPTDVTGNPSPNSIPIDPNKENSRPPVPFLDSAGRPNRLPHNERSAISQRQASDTSKNCNGASSPLHSRLVPIIDLSSIQDYWDAASPAKGLGAPFGPRQMCFTPQSTGSATFDRSRAPDGTKEVINSTSMAVAPRDDLLPFGPVGASLSLLGGFPSTVNPEGSESGSAALIHSLMKSSHVVDVEHSTLRSPEVLRSAPDYSARSSLGIISTSLLSPARASLSDGTLPLWNPSLMLHTCMSEDLVHKAVQVDCDPRLSAVQERLLGVLDAVEKFQHTLSLPLSPSNSHEVKGLPICHLDVLMEEIQALIQGLQTQKEESGANLGGCSDITGTVLLTALVPLSELHHQLLSIQTCAADREKLHSLIEEGLKEVGCLHDLTVKISLSEKVPVSKLSILEKEVLRLKAELKECQSTLRSYQITGGSTSDVSLSRYRTIYQKLLNAHSLMGQMEDVMKGLHMESNDWSPVL